MISKRVSHCAQTTEGNEPKTPKGASKEKTALDVELATAVKLKSSILAAKGTTLCKTITGGDAGLVVCTMRLERDVENYNRYTLTTTLT